MDLSFGWTACRLAVAFNERAVMDAVAAKKADGTSLAREAVETK